MSSGGKGGGGKVQVVDYFLSIHFGACVGPVDQITDVKIGEKSIGIAPITANGETLVDNRELFGGPKKGGGIAGRIYAYLGGPTQLLTAEDAARCGRTPTTVSGYRGLLSVMFSGSGSDGFYWGSNNPVLPAVSIRAKRSCVGLTGDDPLIGSDANPAHIIHECIINREWGAGYDPATRVNTQTFLDAAQTLRDEEFGLSFLWLRQTPIEQFVYEVLAHINANLTFNLTTGKWDLKLLRGDYDLTDLPEVNPSNAKLLSFQRKGWGEIVNEIVVTWTNPENEKEETVAQHDNSGLAIQDQTVSDGSKQYPGIRSQGLALRAAERDLRQAAAPLASAEVEVSPELWGIKPGDVVSLNWYEKDEATGEPFLIEPIVMRVLQGKYGKKGSAAKRLTLIEDIFSFGVSAVSAQGSGFTNPAQDPINVQDTVLGSTPYYLLATVEGDNAAQSAVYPAVRPVLLTWTGLTDIRSIDVLSEVTNAAGGVSFQETGTIDETPRYTLSEDLVTEVSTTFDMPVGHGIPVGSFLVVLKSAEPEKQEIMLVTASGFDTVTVDRGILDTIPRTHTIGEEIWALRNNYRFLDSVDRIAGDEPGYKFLPVTSKGRLPSSSATTKTVLLDDRTYQPTRPGDLRVNGDPVPDTVVLETDTDFEVTWANRNRITETSVVLAWNDASVPPEAGQTTSIRVLVNDVLEHSVDGVTDQTATIAMADIGDPVAGDIITVQVFAMRDGFESWQRSTIDAVVTA